jgi:hypothetical protein
MEAFTGIVCKDAIDWRGISTGQHVLEHLLEQVLLPRQEVCHGASRKQLQVRAQLRG